MTILTASVRIVRINLTLKMKEDLLSKQKLNCFIFNHQHFVQKSLITFLG